MTGREIFEIARAAIDELAEDETVPPGQVVKELQQLREHLRLRLHNLKTLQRFRTTKKPAGKPTG